MKRYLFVLIALILLLPLKLDAQSLNILGIPIGKTYSATIDSVTHWASPLTLTFSSNKDGLEATSEVRPCWSLNGNFVIRANKDSLVNATQFIASNEDASAFVALHRDLERLFPNDIAIGLQQDDDGDYTEIFSDGKLMLSIAYFVDSQGIAISIAPAPSEKKKHR